MLVIVDDYVMEIRHRYHNTPIPSIVNPEQLPVLLPDNEFDEMCDEEAGVLVLKLDQPEIDRLNLHHVAMEGLYEAPIKEPRMVLDVGTGYGYMGFWWV